MGSPTMRWVLGFGNQLVSRLRGQARGYVSMQPTECGECSLVWGWTRTWRSTSGLPPPLPPRSLPAPYYMDDMLSHAMRRVASLQRLRSSGFGDALPIEGEVWAVVPSECSALLAASIDFFSMRHGVGPEGPSAMYTAMGQPGDVATSVSMRELPGALCP